MKKTISRAVFVQAKTLLAQGKKQFKIAKKLKIGTGTVSKIKNAKTYTVYCGKKTTKAYIPKPSDFFGIEDAVRKSRGQISSTVSLYDLDRNFALDKKVKKLQVEVKKNPAFAKLVESEVALAMTEKLTKATADKQGTIDTQAKRISELTIQADKDLQELVSLRAFGVYVDNFLGKWMSISSNAFKIFRLAVILIFALIAGYVTLAISHIRL